MSDRPKCGCGCDIGLVLLEERYWCPVCLQALVVRLRAEAAISVGEKGLYLEDTKLGFLNLCAQYKQLGTFLKLMAKALSHPAYRKSGAPNMMEKVLEQYQQIGEQMKNVGGNLDNLGGKPVMFPSAATIHLKDKEGE